MTFLTLLAISIAVLLVTAYLRGPNTAVGVATVFSFCCPRWIHGDWINADLDLPIAVGLISLGYYVLDKRSAFRTRLISVDFVALAFFATGIASDFASDGMSWWTIVIFYCEWVVPYLLGRLALMNRVHVNWLALSVVICSAFISCACIVESASRVNIFECLVGERLSVLPKYMERFGWQRAFGPTENPIYLGALLVLLLPWTAFFSLSKLRDTKNWWKTLFLVLSFLGIFSCISRAPLFALGIFPLVTGFILFQRLRLTVTFVTVIAIAFAIFNWNSIKQDLKTLGGENVEAPSQKIMLDGEMVNYSSTEHRLQLWRLYRTAIERAGLLGYGSDRTSVFPPNVPMGGEHDLAALKSLWCIDNQYLLLTLRFGFLGLALWILLQAASIWGFAFIARNESDENRTLFALLAAAIVAVAIIQLTVWMPHDYGFVLMWTIGLSAGAVSTSTSRNRFVHNARYR